jgi:hypothetical protein
MVTTRDYPADRVHAARSVLLELAHLLGQYRDDVALVGGWVPELLFPEAELAHVGSLDVDLALNHRTLHDSGYRTIHELLLDRGYTQQTDGEPSQYFRNVPTPDGQGVTVRVDFLAGEYGGRGRRHRHQHVGGVQPRKARACDLAFAAATEIKIEGVLPGGGRDLATLQVTDVTTFIIMKGMALDDRLKEKDAWDIYFCLRSHPGGTAALAERLKPLLKHGFVREGLAKIADKFSSAASYGPVAVANFEEQLGSEERVIRQVTRSSEYRTCCRGSAHQHEQGPVRQRCPVEGAQQARQV